jgi:hypothetical protein
LISYKILKSQMNIRHRMCTFSEESISNLTWILSIQNSAPLYLSTMSRDNGRPVRFRFRNQAGVPPRERTHITQRLLSDTRFRPMAVGTTNDSTVSDLGELQINLNYIVYTTDTASEQPFLRRVAKVDKDFHTLAPTFKNNQTQTNHIPSSRYTPKRRLTFDFSSLSSNEETDGRNRYNRKDV